MTANVFRFTFEPMVPLAEAEMTMHLATYAVEGLYGEARVRLEVSYHIDDALRSITVGGGTEVGAALVKVFTRLLIRELGEDGFHVRPVDASGVPTGQAARPPDSAERVA